MEYVKSNRPAIAVDLDDVVFPCAEGLVAAYNEHSTFSLICHNRPGTYRKKRYRSDLMDYNWGRRQAW